MTNFAAAALLLSAVAGFSQPAAPVKFSLADAQAARKEIMKDREETRSWLKSDPGSYLAAIRRVDFGGKSELSVGSAEGNDVRLDGVSSRHLKIVVKGDQFEVAAVDPGAAFSVGASTAAPAVRSAALAPGAIRVGRYTLKLSHQGYPAIIVFDPKSPRFKEYHGVPYFPIDLSYRYAVKLVPDAKPEIVLIASSHSGARRATRVGWFEFLAGGKLCRLAAYHLEEPGVDPEALIVFFRDATTGKQTYAVGRYADPEKQAGGSYLLDFNTAYSPACAFSSFYNCPIPPRENTLSVAIKAGQQDPHYH